MLTTCPSKNKSTTGFVRGTIHMVAEDEDVSNRIKDVVTIVVTTLEIIMAQAVAIIITIQVFKVMAAECAAVSISAFGYTAVKSF